MKPKTSDGKGARKSADALPFEVDRRKPGRLVDQFADGLRQAIRSVCRRGETFQPASPSMHARPAFFAALALSLGLSPSVRAAWTFDSSAKTLSDGTFVLKNVTVSGSTLTIGDNKSNADIAGDVDLSSGIVGGYVVKLCVRDGNDVFVIADYCVGCIRTISFYMNQITFVERIVFNCAWL